MKTHSLTIRLEADLEQELEAVCAETGRSRGLRHQCVGECLPGPRPLR